MLNVDDHESNSDESTGASAPKNRFKCRICGKTFESGQALGGHQNAHRAEREEKRAKTIANIHPKWAHLLINHYSMMGPAEPTPPPPLLGPVPPDPAAAMSTRQPPFCAVVDWPNTLNPVGYYNCNNEQYYYHGGVLQRTASFAGKELVHDDDDDDDDDAVIVIDDDDDDDDDDYHYYFNNDDLFDDDDEVASDIPMKNYDFLGQRIMTTYHHNVEDGEEHSTEKSSERTLSNPIYNYFVNAEVPEGFGNNNNNNNGDEAAAVNSRGQENQDLDLELRLWWL